MLPRFHNQLNRKLDEMIESPEKIYDPAKKSGLTSALAVVLIPDRKATPEPGEPRSRMSATERPRHPQWIKARLPSGEMVRRTAAVLRRHRVATVCREARCPNLGECFADGTATFMILGRVCTRRCGFCAVEHGWPRPADPTEPQRLACAAAEMDLRHVVITSVTRDDLPDGGASHFRRCAEAVKAALAQCSIEVLVPDFAGRRASLDPVLAAPIDVVNHNVETVPRLYATVRPQADFERSLALLKTARQRRPPVKTKSGLMLGLGETADEIHAVLCRLREGGCSFLTLGQYLQPTRENLPVVRFAPPGEFDEWAATSRSLGFEQVQAGPLVRSSYHAGACWRAAASPPSPPGLEA